MTFKHDVILFVCNYCEVRLRQEFSYYGTVYNRIALAIFFLFAKEILVGANC